MAVFYAFLYILLAIALVGIVIVLLIALANSKGDQEPQPVPVPVRKAPARNSFRGHNNGYTIRNAGHDVSPFERGENEPASNGYVPSERDVLEAVHEWRSVWDTGSNPGDGDDNVVDGEFYYND